MSSSSSRMAQVMSGRSTNQGERDLPQPSKSSDVLRWERGYRCHGLWRGGPPRRLYRPRPAQSLGWHLSLVRRRAIRRNDQPRGGEVT